MYVCKLVRITIAVLAIIGFVTVGLMAQEEDKQSDGKEKVEYDADGKREPENKDVEKEKEVRYRSFPKYPSMHSPEPDPGTDPDDPILDSIEDTNDED